MSLDQIILSINTAGTLAIGSICFFIVYTSFKDLEEDVIQEFSKRFMFAIASLILFVSYFMVYTTFFSQSILARYPLYFILVAVFISLIYSTIAFEKIARKYGISQETKFAKMEKEEDI